MYNNLLKEVIFTRLSMETLRFSEKVNMKLVGLLSVPCFCFPRLGCFEHRACLIYEYGQANKWFSFYFFCFKAIIRLFLGITPHQLAGVFPVQRPCLGCRNDLANAQFKNCFSSNFLGRWIVTDPSQLSEWPVPSYPISRRKSPWL